MTALDDFKPIDYLVIGHITTDLTDAGFRLGGTATFSSLTANALGHSVGIVTSCKASTNFSEISSNGSKSKDLPVMFAQKCCKAALDLAL